MKSYKMKQNNKQNYGLPASQICPEFFGRGTIENLKPIIKPTLEPIYKTFDFAVESNHNVMIGHIFCINKNKFKIIEILPNGKIRTELLNCHLKDVQLFDFLQAWLRIDRSMLK